MTSTTTNPITSPLDDAARQATGGELQAALVDLIDLSLLAKQAHWTVVGDRFRSVHGHLDELVTMTRRYVDRVAERSAAIGVAPDGTASTVARGSEIESLRTGWCDVDDVVRHMTDTLATVMARMRARVDATDKTDLVTQELFLEVTGDLEQQHWMWQAQRA